MKIGDLSGALLDYWVARAEGRLQPVISGGKCLVSDGLIIVTVGGQALELPGYSPDQPYSPSIDWAQAGPIIERLTILVQPWHDRGYAATLGETAEHELQVDAFGSTYLEAAMRCCLVARFGKRADLSTTNLHP